MTTGKGQRGHMNPNDTEAERKKPSGGSATIHLAPETALIHEPLIVDAVRLAPHSRKSERSRECCSSRPSVEER